MRLLALALFAAGLAFAQTEPGPVLSALGVQHGASYAPLGLRDDVVSPAGIAPGSIFLLKGDRLGPDELVAGVAPFGLRLPDEPGGTEVHVRSLATGKVAQARILHAWAFQVAALLPEDFPVGDAEVQVWYRGLAGKPARVPVVRSYPAIFSTNATGHGRGVIQNYESANELPLNALTRSARPGQHLTAWGTGLGAALSHEVYASILGRAVPVEYAGRSPGLPGVDQFNLHLPDDLASFGCYVPLVLGVGEVAGGEVTLAIAPEGGPCAHPWGLTPERLAALEAGERATYLRLELSDGTSSIDPSVFSGARSGSAAYGEAFALDVSGVESLCRSTRTGFANQIIPASRFTCGFPDQTVSVGVVWLEGDFITPPPPLEDPPIRGADVGFPWRLSGPSGESLELPKEENRWFDVSGVTQRVTREAGFLAPGVWSLTVPGGAQIGPVETVVSMPAVPEIASPDVIRRGERFALTWPVAQTQEPLAAAVQISARAPGPHQPGQPTSLGFACPVSYSTGRLEVSFEHIPPLLDDSMEVEVTFRVTSLTQPPPIPGLDRFEVNTTAFRAWSVPLE